MSDNGKGFVKAVGGVEGSGPEYIYRDPQCKPTAKELSGAFVTCSVPTKSTIKTLKKRQDYAATVGSMFSVAASQCRSAASEIIAICKAQQKKFFDKTFYYDSRETMYPPGSPPDCTVTEPTAAIRLSDMYPDAPLFSQGISSLDVCQGAIGDCFFIGAVSALASVKVPEIDPIGRLFVVREPQWGLYGVVFYKNGGWEWVIIDDFIAAYQSRRTASFVPLFASAPSDELWPMLLEKAFAKVHHCWDGIDGGLTREALADLTGGIEWTFDINSAQDFSFDLFHTIASNPLNVLGCSVGQHIQETEGTGPAGEQGALFGLFKGHAYSVLRTERTADGCCFVRVRNPWGNSAEWRGPYGDHSKEWDLHPAHVEQLKPLFKDDGAFWMKWEDFKFYLSVVDICEYFTRKTNVISMYGSYALSNYLSPEQTFILDVGGNPDDTTTVVLSLGQEDPKVNPNHLKAKSRDYAVIQLSVYSLNSVPTDYSQLKYCIGQRVATPIWWGLSVDVQLHLPPGAYSIIPKMRECPEGIGYYVRAFCPSNGRLSMYRFSKPGLVLSTTEPARGAGRNAAGRKLMTFTKSGGVKKAMEEAFALADPWMRGRLDRRMAEQAFAQLLMHSDLGYAFSDAAANIKFMAKDEFKRIAGKLVEDGPDSDDSPQPL